MIKAYDPCIGVIPESTFDEMFAPDFFARGDGGNLIDHIARNQRRLDINVFMQMYHLWRDKNYFDISPRLCSKLTDTDLRDLDTFFLRTPYRSMYISVPRGNGLYIHNDYSGKHEVTGIYLIMDEFEKPKEIGLKSSGKVVSGVTKYLNILVCGEEKQLYDDALVFFHLMFWDGKISESIEKNKMYITGDSSLWPEIESVFSFCVKILLYLNCANVSIQEIAGLNLDAKIGGLKNPAKKRKLLQRYEKLSTRPHKLLDIVVDHTPVDSHHQASTGSVGSIGPKSLEKVRGHFKGQRYGEGWSMSKIIWVEPYVRGSGAEFFRDEKHYKVV
jgi:hypothetical protein